MILNCWKNWADISTKISFSRDAKIFSYSEYLNQWQEPNLRQRALDFYYRRRWELVTAWFIGQNWQAKNMFNEVKERKLI